MFCQVENETWNEPKGPLKGGGPPQFFQREVLFCDPVVPACTRPELQSCKQPKCQGLSSREHRAGEVKGLEVFFGWGACIHMGAQEIHGWGYAGFSLSFYLPGFHVGPPVLSHCHMILE